MAGPTLYELGAELEPIYAELEANGGELTEELAKRLDVAEGDFDAKAERVALMCRTFATQRLAVSTERKRLEARESALEKAEANLKRYLLETMRRVGRDGVRGTLVTVRVQDSPPAVRSILQAIDLEALRLAQPAYVRVTPEVVALDSRAVLEAYQKGASLPEGVSVERGKHVRFY